jgi:hypothetical protein
MRCYDDLQVISVLPEREVVAITLIPIDINITFSRIGIDKDDCSNICLSYKCFNLRSLVVVKNALVNGAISQCLVL